MFFKKKKEEISFPHHYARIVFNDYALEQGVFDKYQKEIQEIKGNRIVRREQYSDVDVKAIKEILKIPIADLTKPEQQEEFKFDTLFSFGEVSEVI